MIEQQRQCVRAAVAVCLSAPHHERTILHKQNITIIPNIIG